MSTSPHIEVLPVNAGGRARPPVRWVLFWLALAVIYAVTGYVCAQISAQVANVSAMFYIPSGISLTASLLWGRKVWPGVFVGEVAMAVATHRSIPTALIMACGNGLDAYLAGWWFRDRPGRRIEFNRLKDVLGLLGGELLFLQPMSAAVGMFAITRGHPLPGSILLQTAASWYSANIYAQFVMAPAALIWIHGLPPFKRRYEGLELAVFSALILAVGAFGYGRWAFNVVPLQAVVILIFPLLVWASIRFAPAVAVTAGSLMGFFAFDAGLAGAGPFGALIGSEKMLSLNLFMAATTSSSIFLAAAMADHRRSEEEQARLIEDLRSASTQVERLKGLVTLCAWTGRVRWEGEWVTIEQFLNERYNVEVTHGISEEAMGKFMADIKKTGAGSTEAAGENAAARH